MSRILLVFAELLVAIRPAGCGRSGASLGRRLPHLNRFISPLRKARSGKSNLGGRSKIVRLRGQERMWSCFRSSYAHNEAEIDYPS